MIIQIPNHNFQMFNILVFEWRLGCWNLNIYWLCYNNSRMNSLKRIKLTDLMGKLLLYLLIIYTFYMLGRSIWQNYELKQQEKAIRAAIAKVEQQNKDLNNLIAYYQSSSFREVEARQKLGLKKPGEKVVIVAQKDSVTNYQTEQNQEQQNIATTEQPTTAANWQLWWNYFTK